MEKDNDKIEKSAHLLANAKRVLILTSAGMSADSNIPTFRDKEGYWKNFPPFKKKGLEAQDLASPWAFRNELPYAWAFYEWRRRNAQKNKPHEGYHIINHWIENRFENAFIHTTNTDGYHLRSGSPPNKLKEVHGSMWRLQCLNVCSYRFWEEENVPLCKLNFECMIASNFPTCPYCRALARPHILMFGDGEYIGHPEQDSSFSEFILKPVDVALLVGSSGTVPTNDYIALSLQERGTKVININPDLSANRVVKADYFIPIKSRIAFLALDEHIRKIK